MTLTEAARHMNSTLAELRKAEQLLRTVANAHECSVAISRHQYEIWRVDSGKVSLIVYPHRTSAGHYHLRVRNNGSKDKTKATEIMDRLDRDSGANCTFQCKSKPST